MIRRIACSLLLLASLAHAQSRAGANSRFFGRLGGSGGGGGGIAFTGKTCKAPATNLATQTCTWSAAPSAGENIYCEVVEYTTGPWSMTDSASNVYIANSTYIDLTPAGGPQGQMFYFPNLSSSITTTSVTTMAATPYFLSLQCISVTGGSVSTVDGAMSGVNANGTSISTTVSPTSSSTILFAYVIATAGAAAITPGSGFTKATSQNYGGTGEQAITYKISSVSGSNTCNATVTPTSDIGIMCQAYK